MTDCPKLRADLIVSRQETPGGVVFVVKDPVIGRFVRFKEPEYFIARQFDGSTPLESIRERTEQELGASLPQATLEGFTGKLKTLGLLESETAAGVTQAQPRPEQPARIRGNPLYLRFRVFDPDKFFERIIPRIRFVFTTPFALFSVGVILLAAGVTVASWGEIHHNFSRLYRPETLAFAWVTLLGIIIGHEFAHGLTCKRFGGKVHEVGMLLIYLQPAMYCNVSDAWLFPEKRKRLLVTLAGAWFEIFCWALATLFWRVTDPATGLNFLALVIATTLGIKSLFNLNPLIKLDGYYLLSDYLEVPNLRRKAFQHVGYSLARLWGGGRNRKEIPTPREKRIYWLYGLLAAAYSTWLIGLILLALGRYLTGRYQGWGFTCFAALVFVFFRHPLRQGAAFLASHFTPRQGIVRLMKRLAKIAIVLGVAAACLYFIQTDLKISGEFRILPIHNADVRAEVEGIVEEVVHDEGDLVAAGEVIARLSDRDYRAQLDNVNAEISEKEAKLRMLKSGARVEEIGLARTAVVKGEERLKFSQNLLEMEKKLFEDKLTSKKDYETAAELAAVRARELEESQGSLKLLLAGARPEEIQALEAETVRLSSQKTYLEDQLKRLSIVSPIAGIVTTHRLREKLGSNLKKGELLAEVHQLQTVHAEITVPEKEISDVHIGQPVVLKARAFLDRKFEGTVAAISPVASKAAEGVAQHTFLVVTQLDNKELALRPEMTGNAKISCGTHRLYEIVGRRLIRFIRVEFWSWW